MTDSVNASALLDIHAEKILIVDFGSQYTQLIARRVREIGVYSELRPYDAVDADWLNAFQPSGIILSGGPESVTEADGPRAADCLFHYGAPVLGICYGMQTMAAQLGGHVAASSEREFGYANVQLMNDSELFAGLVDESDASDNGLETVSPQTLDVWMSHGDRVDQVPPGFVITAASEHAPIAAMACEAKRFYGVQFHPEVTHTPQGFLLLTHFVKAICGCQALWNSEHIIEEQVQRVRAEVGTDEVILGLSGGVDSAVVAALLHRAIGDQLTCVFVDNGLLRLNEADHVMQTFKDAWGMRVIRVDAGDYFLSQLSGVSDPEEKRKKIGGAFVEIFEQEAGKRENARWLAQGTIYPDVIESAGTKSGKAHVIKSHHNVGGLPAHMSLKLLEPLRELFKDEVRTLGLALGLPHDWVYRHPFPGPGLGVRILGEIKRPYIDLLQQADFIFISELRQAGLYEKVSQAFAVFLPVKSVGVMGDARQYDYVVALRAVETLDFMTARWAHLPYDFLGRVSNRIMNEVKGIARVTYDISSKPPATIEWE